MPNADEVAAAVAIPNGDLGHAIRFILPNLRMASFPDGPDNDDDREPMYVRPASHAGGPSGPESTIPYGSRLRLRSDFPMTGYNAAAQVILRTMQRYGIVLSDGGNIALTFESDVNTTAKWATLGVPAQVFWNGTPGGNRNPVRVADFTVLATGDRILETYECEPTNIAIGASVFRNGFE
jgi:serine/threonine-protein kinase